jgi:hypothetical protein
LTTRTKPVRQSSRVSRRQIVEASWVFNSSDESSDSETNETNGTCDVKEAMTEIETVIQPVLIPQPSTSSVSESKPILDRLQCFPMIDVRTGEMSGKCGNNNENDGLSHQSATFGGGAFCRTLDVIEKDTFESYISTRTDETETNAYNFADPFNDTASVASTNYESRF